MGRFYFFFWKAENATCSSGFTIRNKIANAKTSLLQVVSDHLITLKLDFADAATLTLISCWFNEESEIASFYEKLFSIVRNKDYHDSFLILGDFNARVGSDHEFWGNVIGCHGIGKMNINELCLLSFCNEFDLLIINTMLQQPNRFETTWVHPRSI